MWKYGKALAVAAPTALMAVWMVPTSSAALPVEVPATPEPAAMMLAGLGLLAAASALRRREGEGE
jgi:MYXO-CTERM domain-containing protein